MNGRWLGLVGAALFVFGTIPVQADKGPCQEGSIKERLACFSKQLGKTQNMAKQGPAGPVGPAGPKGQGRPLVRAAAILEAVSPQPIPLHPTRTSARGKSVPNH
jgi:hypothetical protein